MQLADICIYDGFRITHKSHQCRMKVTYMSEAMPGAEISVDPVSSEMPVSVEMRAASAVLDNVRLDEGTERFANRRGSLQSEAL